MTGNALCMLQEAAEAIDTLPGQDESTADSLELAELVCLCVTL